VNWNQFVQDTWTVTDTFGGEQTFTTLEELDRYLAIIDLATVESVMLLRKVKRTALLSALERQANAHMTELLTFGMTKSKPTSEDTPAAIAGNAQVIVPNTPTIVSPNSTKSETTSPSAEMSGETQHRVSTISGAQGMNQKPFSPQTPRKISPNCPGGRFCQCTDSKDLPRHHLPYYT
jgi:hypothetical protein